MKKEQIFLGNIKRCVKFSINDDFFEFGIPPILKIEDELYKENAILIKTKNGDYVDLENLTSFIDYIKLYVHIKKNYYQPGSLLMPTHANYINALFVDEQSLRPYQTKEQKDISVYQLIKKR